MYTVYCAETNKKLGGPHGSLADALQDAWITRAIHPDTQMQIRGRGQRTIDYPPVPSGVRIHTKFYSTSPCDTIVVIDTAAGSMYTWIQGLPPYMPAGADQPTRQATLQSWLLETARLRRPWTPVEMAIGDAIDRIPLAR